MNAEIQTLSAEKENLELHVDLCAQRYHQLEKRLDVLENKVDVINQTLAEGRNSLAKVIITASASIIGTLLAAILTIVIKF